MLFLIRRPFRLFRHRRDSLRFFAFGAFLARHLTGIAHSSGNPQPGKDVGLEQYPRADKREENQNFFHIVRLLSVFSSLIDKDTAGCYQVQWAAFRRRQDFRPARMDDFNQGNKPGCSPVAPSSTAARYRPNTNHGDVSNRASVEDGVTGSIQICCQDIRSSSAQVASFCDLSVAPVRAGRKDIV